MYEGQSSLVDVYMNDAFVGVGSLFQTWEGHVTGCMVLNIERVQQFKGYTVPPAHPLMWDSIFSFVDKNSGKRVGYYYYSSGNLEIMQHSIYVTRAVFRKSLVDVVQTNQIPALKFLGMGEK